MAEYRFASIWHIKAPLQHVFDAVADSLHWPDWWRGVQAVTQLEAGNDDGVGCVRRYCWKSRLSYQLYFDAHTTRVEPMYLLEATIDGDLEGWGRWSFSHQDGVTTIRHQWQVRTTRCWMNLAAPVARPLFAANHHALMRQGAEGLARRLDADLLPPGYRELKQGGALPPHVVNLAAAAIAGTVAGIVATIVQMALWWSASYALPEMLLRDTRLAAAILMGRAILPPPLSFDWRALLAATTVHFALSISYGLLLAPLLSRLKLALALAAGAGFGLALYGINMYGFTVLFPWFSASRSWITIVAHIAFGITAAAVYKFWSKKEVAGQAT